MLDLFFAEFRDQAAVWRAEVAHRRARSAMDPVADAMESCAQDLEARVQLVERHTDRVTPEQYGELHGVRPQSVRRWIRAGELEATRTGNGWEIPRDAVRTQRLKLEKAG
jgi:excisionase family DNA binding protein